MATNYQKGRALEYKVRDLFIKHGYFVVRSAGSKGKADLVALKAGHRPVLIQCKSGAVAKREREEAVELHALAESLAAEGVLAAKDAKGKVLMWRAPGSMDEAMLDYRLSIEAA